MQWFGHVERRPLEHAGRQIIDNKPPEKETGRLRTRWMDAVNRDTKIARLERKMADARRRWDEPSMTSHI